MKIRITGGGFENYTGQMGVIFFTNGLSDGDVLTVDAIRVAGVIGAEWEDGTPANVSQHYLDNMNTPAPMFDADAVEVSPEVIEIAIGKAIATGVFYTEAQLGTIADKGGIAGLREISDPLLIKGNSIVGLIAAILKVAGAPTKELVAAPVEVVPEVVAEELPVEVVPEAVAEELPVEAAVESLAANTDAPVPEEAQAE